MINQGHLAKKKLKKTTALLIQSKDWSFLKIKINALCQFHSKLKLVGLKKKPNSIKVS